MLACTKHWYQLPRDLRHEVWAEYVPGQEITKTPTPDYLATVEKCIDFWLHATR